MAFLKENVSIEAQFADRAIHCLRQIRSSSFHWMVGSNPIRETQIAIRDAERVGMIVAAYLIDPIGQNDHSSKQKIDLEKSLAGLESEYAGYRDYSYSSKYGRMTIHDTLPTLMDVYGTLVYYSDKTGHSELWNAAKGRSNNELMPGLNVFNDRLGIVSPLSSDYFEAILLQRFIQQQTDLPCFKLKPLILSSALELDPNQGQGQKDDSFAGSVDEIAVWTNLDVSRRTRVAASLAVKSLYPEKIKHGLIFTPTF